LRCDILRASFEGSKSAAQRSNSWTRLAFRLNTSLDTNFEAAQLQNKYQSLKSEYTKIVKSLNETGNATESPIETPEYWETLQLYFQKLSGLGDKDYGQSDSSSVPSSDGLDECPMEDEGKDEMSNGFSKTQKSRSLDRKMDTSQGLIRMAEILSEGLVKSSKPESSDQFNAIALTLNKINDKLSESNEINRLLLEFIKK
jgi:hypothetical protein